jgi:hypothetical protein
MVGGDTKINQASSHASAISIQHISGRRAGGMGSLAELSDEAIESVIREKLVGQVDLACHGLANVRPDGVFIITGGMSAFTSLPNM